MAAGRNGLDREEAEVENQAVLEEEEEEEGREEGEPQATPMSEHEHATRQARVSYSTSNPRRSREASALHSSRRRSHTEYPNDYDIDHTYEHELQTIPSRREVPPTPNRAQNPYGDESSRNFFRERGNRAIRILEDFEDSSLREDIRNRVQRARAEKRRKRLDGTAWQDRLRTAVSPLWQKVIIEGLLRRKTLPSTKDGRHVPLSVGAENDGLAGAVGANGLIDERSGQPYISNFIRSSRYTVWTFLPAQLIFQFSKLGNFYLLVVGILQTIPGLSTVGKYTTIAPLAAFIVLSMLKEGSDDYRRYLLDKAENRSVVWVSRYGVREGREPPKKTSEGSKGGVTGPITWLAMKTFALLTRILQGGAPAENSASLFAQDDLGADQTPLKPGQGWDQDGWMSIEWQQIQVGDIIRLGRDQAVPADIVLLGASGPENIAYIETMALDGETNLKSKQASPELAQRCETLEAIRALNESITVVSEDPNLDLYNYEGRLAVDGEVFPLSLDNVVYRGSTVRNTTSAIGLVINTGEECKIRMNANKNVKAKKPAMQSIVNRMVLVQIVIVLALAVGFTIGYALWKKDRENNAWYLKTDGLYDAAVPFKQIFFGFVVMFNSLIPLSLYISMEIIKLGQMVLLQDPEMYDPVTDTPMVANTSTILENLGQVGYVFSDKTGTLTENIMRFRNLSVAGVAFLHDMDVDRDELARQTTIQSREAASAKLEKGKRRVSGFYAARRSSVMSSASEREPSSSRPPHGGAGGAGGPDLKTEDLLDHLRRKPNTGFARKARFFLLCIALCHTCLPEVKENGETHYQAASPDELALVEAAKDLGYLLVDRPARSIKIQTEDSAGNPHLETYDVLDVIEFSSKRKRMSIIIRMPDGRICLFCKGADNVILSLLRQNHLAEQEAKDVNRRASIRKTTEQDGELRRRSTQHGHVRESPAPRTSKRFSLTRQSSETNRLSQQEAVGSWLSRRNTAELIRSPGPSADAPGRSGGSAAGAVPWPRRNSQGAVDRCIDDAYGFDDAAIYAHTFQHTDRFASQGLRTLLYAYRYLDDETYASWKGIYQRATTSLENRQELIEEAGAVIEAKLELAGATAIEDKLQDGVPDTIEKLRRAKIKVWMLTGDKRETAINIGHSARVCKPSSEIYILDSSGGGGKEKLLDTLTNVLNEVARGMVPHSVVVVDGGTLAEIDADDDLAILFYDLVIRVDSVICCRASPSQKAQLVRSIRRFVPKVITLAIGDGANDIGMIQASHVGIGISGREGLQASRISDYSIAQFRFLQKLLFVHGRWNYLRTGKYVLATFWKELFFYLVQAHYQRYNGYTGTSMFESASLTVFNTLFTSLPVILMGMFEQDLKQETLLEVPELYTFGQEGLGFSYGQYFGWQIVGTAGSAINYYFTFLTYGKAFSDEDTSLYAFGVICFTAGVIFINVKLLILELHTKTIITFTGFGLSILGWFLWLCALAGVYQNKFGEYLVRNGFFDNFGRQLMWWANVGLNLGALTILELVVQAVRRVYFPTDQDFMQRIEREAYKKQKKQKKDQGRAGDEDEVAVTGEEGTDRTDGLVKKKDVVFVDDDDEY